jgi:hypothetical protein
MQTLLLRILDIHLIRFLLNTTYFPMTIFNSRVSIGIIRRIIMMYGQALHFTIVFVYT